MYAELRAGYLVVSGLHLSNKAQSYCNRGVSLLDSCLVAVDIAEITKDEQKPKGFLRMVSMNRGNLFPVERKVSV